MCACGARVTVVFLCVCVCVHSASSVTHATKRQTKHTGGLSIIVALELIWHFFVKCGVTVLLFLLCTCVYIYIFL